MKGLRQKYWSKVTKGEKSALRGEGEKCCQWKATGQCSRGDSCSLSHGSNRGQHTRPVLLQKHGHTLTEELLRKDLVPGEKALLGEKAGNRVKKPQIRRVIVGILPYVRMTSLYRDASSATNVCLDTLRLMGGPISS